MSIPPYTSEKLPGLRDHSGKEGSHGGHGISEILNVIEQLSASGILSCVVGVRALRYYGAARVTDVHPPFPGASALLHLTDNIVGMGSLCS